MKSRKVNGGDDVPYVSCPTGAEQKLAKALKKKKWPFFRNEQVEGFEVDFYLPESRLIIEVDGFTHLSGAKLQLDKIKDERLIEKGYIVLRLSNQRIREDIRQCVVEIDAAIRLFADCQSDCPINIDWKERLRRIPVKEPPKLPRQNLTVEEYFLSQEKKD